jgi:hypothetical protein
MKCTVFWVYLHAVVREPDVSEEQIASIFRLDE